MAEIAQVKEKSVGLKNLAADFLTESAIVKKRYKGKVYATTQRMIDAVIFFDEGRIEKIDLLESASWAADPESAIRVAQMIAGTGEFR